MAVLRPFRACVGKLLPCQETLREETELSKTVDSTFFLIQHFLAFPQVPARGVPGGPSSRSAHDSCTHCGLPVFLAERLLVGSKRALYHRTCFRCARCSAQLTLANFYETEDGKFCCETCPDEEVDKSDTSSQGTDRADFPESKSGSICSAEAFQKPSEFHLGGAGDAANTTDEFSALFESSVERFHQKKNPPHLISSESPLALPQEAPIDLFSKSDDLQNKSVQNIFDKSSRANLTLTNECEPVDNCDELSQCQSTKEDTKPPIKALAETEERYSRFETQNSATNDQMSFPNARDNMNSVSDCSDVSVMQPPASVSTYLGDVNNCTKDSKTASAGSSVSSIVKMRKMMFEGGNIRSVDALNSVSQSDVAPNEERATEGHSPVLIVSPLKCEEYVVEKDAEFVERRKEIHEVVCGDEGVKAIHKTPKENRSSSSNDIPEGHNRKELFYDIGHQDKAENFSETLKTQPTEVESLDCSIQAKPVVSPRKTISSLKDVLPQTEKSDYPDELNPFGDDDDDEISDQKVDSLMELQKESTNPFGSSDDDDEPVTLRTKSSQRPPRPPLPISSLQPNSDNLCGSSSKAACASTAAIPVAAQRRTVPPEASLNPFWSDGEEPADDNHHSTPVPLPRTIRVTPEPSPRPRTTAGLPSKLTSSSGKFGSSSSLSSMVSNTGTNRRSKKPAPAPPSSAPGGSTSRNSSIPSSPNPSLRSPLKRKSRPAPQPPAVSTSEVPDLASSKSASLDGRKLIKDEANRSKQAFAKEEQVIVRDKSTYGQWKRKKGPAPPRPLPQRRQVQAMPLKEVKRELDDIEVKQLELERQGVKLERTIRLKFDEVPHSNDSSMTPAVEDLVIQLFELVNEKNELFRKQAELMYLRRQQRLEEEHAELEYQIRCLMEQPERNKTDTIKAREEELIQRLVEVVERRNEIIECLEMDRLREAEEDQSIHSRLGLIAAKHEKDTKELSPPKSKKEKKKKKDKDSKKKKDGKVDADKDIDEVEAAAVAAAKEKKGKKKWF